MSLAAALLRLHCDPFFFLRLAKQSLIYLRIYERSRFFLMAQSGLPRRRSVRGHDKLHWWLSVLL